MPRSSRRQQQRQRRVRFTDDLQGGQEVVAGGAVDPESAAGTPDGTPDAAPVEECQEPRQAGVGAGSAALQDAGGAKQHAAGGGQSSSMRIRDAQDGIGSADVLAAQLGQLYVADATTQAAAAAGPSPAQGSARAASNSIAIQQKNAVVPREWLEVPQFYAHSPVGSNSSLAGSFASPLGSAGNLAVLASSPPPARGGAIAATPVSPPTGLPRPPPSGAGSWAAHTRQGQQAASRNDADASKQQQPQQDQNGQAPGTGQPLLTRHQAQQLQRAFPPLAASLPPELEAMLAASDSEAPSGGEESEDWTASDDEADALGSGRCGGRCGHVPLSVVVGSRGCAGWPRMQQVCRTSASRLLVQGLPARMQCSSSLHLNLDLQHLNHCSSEDGGDGMDGGTGSRYRVQLSFFGVLFTHLEAWVTPDTGGRWMLGSGCSF